MVPARMTVPHADGELWGRRSRTVRYLCCRSVPDAAGAGGQDSTIDISSVRQQPPDLHAEHGFVSRRINR